MAEIKAIETIYNGYRFRSRLEARWAVFFDAAGIEYQYEAEGYKLSNGMNYLPDFWLPQLDCWVEIKGEWPSDEDWLKMCFLANDSTYRVLLLGQIPISNNDLPDNYYGVKIYGFYPDGTLDYHDDSLCFCQCDLCEKWGFVYEGRIRQCGCRNTDRVYGNRDKVEDAYRKARQARFEHGEEPRLNTTPSSNKPEEVKKQARKPITVWDIKEKARQAEAKSGTKG